MPESKNKHQGYKEKYVEYVCLLGLSFALLVAVYSGYDFIGRKLTSCKGKIKEALESFEVQFKQQYVYGA